MNENTVMYQHHGHMNCSMEVYAEPEVPAYLADAEKLRRMGRIRMYGTAVTRKWMDILGVQKHYVTKDGTNKIII